MNIFATKDGKIYRVSMKNFVDATGKKAPYYKRTEKKGKVHENGYALCPGCGNPVHFVNLFNKSRKKKKAHARHQRSSIKGLTMYNADAYGCCPFGSKNPAFTKDASKSEGIIAPFSGSLMTSFGLSQESADLLGKIYLLLKNQDPENAEHDFLALIASVTYNKPYTVNQNNGTKDFSLKDYFLGLFWNAIADIKNDEQSKNRLISLDITEDEIEHLVRELQNQHALLEDSSQPYYKKPDLTHMCATAAAILTKKIDKEIGGVVVSGFSGTASGDASAGYIGDLCISDNGEPSMNDGDYKADLDAVNIAALVKDNPNVSLLSIINGYYCDIEAGQFNRAELFEENVSLETLDNQRNAYRANLQLSLLLSDAQKESRLALFDKFVDCIKHKREAWSDDE